MNSKFHKYCVYLLIIMPFQEKYSAERKFLFLVKKISTIKESTKPKLVTLNDFLRYILPSFVVI